MGNLYAIHKCETALAAVQAGNGGPPQVHPPVDPFDGMKHKVFSGRLLRSVTRVANNPLSAFVPKDFASVVNFRNAFYTPHRPQNLQWGDKR